MKLNCFEEVEALTKKLVSINSVNASKTGETDMAEYIFSCFSEFTYFKNNPEQLFTFSTEDDVVERKSVIAYIKGNGPKTIILMGHIDTVDVKDYGPASGYAYNCDLLPEKLKEYFSLNEEVIKDIDSGDYLFGRGALDMKSGVASSMYVMKYFLNHPEELNGNLLFLGECDEEGGSLGIISALKHLNRIKEKENFEYIACINNDFHTPVGDNDQRCVHIGTVGKLLPCFAVFGKEAHVGKAFDSFDPNLLLAEITKRISLNPDFCDSDGTHTTVPPVSLKIRDDKDSYTVQTASGSFGYYNCLIYNSSPEKIMDACKKIAEDSFEEIIELLNAHYHTYCDNNGYEYQKLPWHKNVYTYSEWYEKLVEDNPSFGKEMDEYALALNKEKPSMDLREFGYEMVKKSYEYYATKEPAVIIFYGTMFYSPVECKDENMLNSIKNAIETVNKESRFKTSLELFYPYISDMSFLCTDFDEKTIEDMLRNSPQHGYKYIYPYKQIKNINVPVINIGTYGKDGHMFTERVEKYHSFLNVPNLTYETIKQLLR